MLKVFGSPLCPDCVKCREAFDKAGIDYLYLDITANLRFLKMFLALREGEGFAAVRQRGQIGIPCIVREDGSYSFQYEEFM